MKKTYCLHPGEVFSENDGERHFISAPTLARLYDVDLKDCVIYGPPYLHHDTLMCLHPDHDGNYKISEKKSNPAGEPL